MDGYFTLRISTENAAFGETTWEAAKETIRILEEVCKGLEYGRHDGPCIDVNGNKVGEYKLDV